MSELSIDWNKASELGLIEKINREILHPLGLSMCRDVDTGVSSKLLIATDGFWKYGENFKSTLKSDIEIKFLLEEIKLDSTGS